MSGSVLDAARESASVESTEEQLAPIASTNLDGKRIPTNDTAPRNQSTATVQTHTVTNTVNQIEDPLSLNAYKRPNVSTKQLKIDHPNANKKELKKFYTRQNELIDQFLQSGDEERQQELDMEVNGPKIQFAIYASSGVNFCLFAIQLYAAIATGSLSLFATCADAFMDLVSSCVMLWTSYLAKKPSVYKYPVGRSRIETMGIILFCAIMTSLAMQLLIESGRALAKGRQAEEELKIVPLVCVGIAIFSKVCMMFYCFFLRRYPACRIFFLDHRNDIFVNVFGLVMSIVGTRLLWWLDPAGAICIGLLIMFSWVSTAFEHVWLMVGKGAPRQFISKVIYMAMTHDDQILKVDTCRAYHAGEKYFCEIDIVMNETAPLKITHDVSQSLQRKIEGLEDVERAFVHVDYEHDHDPYEEHKPLYPPRKPSRTFRERMVDAKKMMTTVIPGLGK